jgi:hypothetical protein
MKRSILIILIAYFRILSFSQSCCPDGIEFVSQDQIDSFQINFPECQEILGDVIINGPDIGNLNGLNAITKIDGILWIYDSEILTNLTGLENLDTIFGGLSVGNYDYEGNTSLISLDGLNNLKYLGWHLDIHDNEVLNDLSALSNLNKVYGTIYIIENINLYTLSGLDNINANSIYDLYIMFNQNLTKCDIKSVCDYLASPNGDVIVVANAPGCYSEDEVLAECTVELDETDIQTSQYTIYPNPFSERITIEIPEFGKKNSIYTLSIFNIKGQLIKQLQLSKPQETVDITELNTGIFFMKIISQDNVFVGRIVKK